MSNVKSRTVGFCGTWLEIPKIGFAHGAAQMSHSLYKQHRSTCTSLQSKQHLFIMLSPVSIPKFLRLGGRIFQNQMSRVMRKPTFCIYENKDADQLRGNRKADQRLCFCYIDSRIPLLPKSENSSP